MIKKQTFLLLLLSSMLFSAPPLELVRDGEAVSEVVIADTATPVASYAADEFIMYMQKITGVALPLKKESESSKQKVRVFIGDTRAAVKAGLEQAKFEMEDWVCKVDGNALYLVGGENEKELLQVVDTGKSVRERGSIIWASNGFVRDARRGTLYAVVDFLDREAGIRWLWPGELGTVIPKKETFAVSKTLDRNGKPPFLNRKYRIQHVLLPEFRGYQEDAVLIPLGFSKKVLVDYSLALRKFLLIHQEGDSSPPPAPAEHLYSFWARYGKEHPEWFALRDDGGRGPLPHNRGITRLCVSNPELRQHMADQWDGSDWIGLGEGDIRSFCRCPECMQWDEPQPMNFNGYSTSNRYIRYAEEVRKLCLKRNPDVKVSILMYMDYILPPAGKRDLSWMAGKFVPWGSGVSCYYPMKESEHENLMNIWQGWQDSGMQMFYRPNYLLSGYAVPALGLRQPLEMLRHVANNGMLGFDYDSLRGHWAGKGPLLYAHMRLGTHPSMSIEEILDEYYDAFGPSSADVKNYFNYWETVTAKFSAGGVSFGNAAEAAELYPDDIVFMNAEKILSTALQKAVSSPDQVYVKRLKFLQLALYHGKLCTEFSRLFRSNSFIAARTKLDEIINFRRAYEDTFFDDLCANMFTEVRGYNNLADFIKGKFRNFHEPGLLRKNFDRAQAEDLVGFKPARWSLALVDGVKSGHVVYKYEAGQDNYFVDADVKIKAPNLHVSNKLELSLDGKEYTSIAFDIQQETFSLTSLVNGKSSFWLRFAAERRANAPKDDLMTLITWRVDFTKKNPEAVAARPQLEIGSGWLDLEASWYYRKDPGNKLPLPVNATELFSDGWIQVPVPARLSRTKVGPYLGHGCYAAEIEIPAHWMSRGADFLFEAVDEQATVYLNGKKIGEHTIASENVEVGILWNEPFIVHAKTEDLKPGKKNFLVVKTHASVGEAGIWKPVKIRPVDAEAQ